MAEVKQMNDPVADQLRSQYPSNSRMVQPSQQQKMEKVQGVTKGRAIFQQDSLGMKIKKMFFPGDIRDIKGYALNNIIIPSLKNGVLALVELTLFGQVRRSNGGYSPSRTNYTYVSSNPQRQTVAQTQASVNQSDRANHNFQNIIFESYQDAEDVIETMVDLLNKYGRVTVAQFYDLARLECDWASENWGWTSFQRLETRAVRGGYIIDVNQPILLR